MALLNKFVTHRPTQIGNPVACEVNDPHVQSIVQNIQTVLQSRRTITNGQKIGLQDYSEQLVSEALMHQLCDDMSQQIAFHEPRLSHVLVSLMESGCNIWSLKITGEVNTRETSTNLGTSSKQGIAFVFELAKSAYVDQSDKVKVVML